MSEQPQQYKAPIVLRWNISDDFYKDGMTLYADGLLHINIGGKMIAKSLRGWFNFEVEADNEVSKWKSEVNRLKAAFDSMSAINTDNGEMADKWKSLAGELAILLRKSGKKMRNDFAIGDEKDFLVSISVVLAKAREMGLK